MAAFLKNIGNLALNIVNFDVFENDRAEKILVRQLTGLETGVSTLVSDGAQKPPTGIQSQVTDTKLLQLFELADKNGVGREFRFVYEQATKQGLFPRLYKWSIMYTPPMNKTRVLIYASVKPSSRKLAIYICATAFAEFYPVLKQDAVRILGYDRNDALNLEDLKSVFKNLDKLFALIDKNKK